MALALLSVVLCACALQAAEPIPEFKVFTNLYTGGELSLVSAVQPAGPDVLNAGSRFEFAFGFGTDEDPVEGEFLDSATLTLQDNGQSHTFIFLTVDASGVTWAPPGGGLDPALLQFTPIDFGGTAPRWKRETAFWVSLEVLPVLDRHSAMLYLDLFDNQNFVNSVAWVSLVPEPGAGVLFSLGLLLHCAWRRARH